MSDATHADDIGEQPPQSRDFLLGALLAEFRAGTREMHAFRISMEKRMDSLEAAVNQRVGTLETAKKGFDRWADRGVWMFYAGVTVAAVFGATLALGYREALGRLWKFAFGWLV